MVKVIATDLDGTLLKPKRKIALVEKNNKKLIKKFYGDTVLVSGRNPKFCAKVCNTLKIDHNFIALNGAIIVKSGNVIYRQSLKKTILNNLFEFIKQNYTSFEFMIFDKYDHITSYPSKSTFLTKFKHFTLTLKDLRLHNKIKVSTHKVEKLLTNQVPLYKALIYVKIPTDDLCHVLKEKFGEHFEFYSTNHSIEISPIGVNKGEALNFLINTTKLTKDDVLVVGDSSNDIPMFNIFKNSFYVNNNNNELKVKANYVIDKFCDLEKYLKMNDNFREG